MIHVAKRFGISDVALRKTCIKHDIPNPPLGYWAKLAHGKKVRQPPLPPLKEGIRDYVALVVRPPRQLPADVSAILQTASEIAVVVPKERPQDLHPIAKAVEKAVKRTSANGDGFLVWGTHYEPTISIGSSSIERSVILLDALAKGLAIRGYEASFDKDLEIRVEGEPFKLRLYETKNREAYQPSPADMKRQAEYDDRSKRYPTLYSPGKKVWPTWNHSPSGRLCIELTDPTLYRWKAANLVGRWYDRKEKRLEGYFGEAIVALMAAAALAKHRRAEAEEKARLEAEEAERRAREKARRERVQKRHNYLLKKAEAFEMHKKLISLQTLLLSKSTEDDRDAVNRIIRTLSTLIETDSRQFEPEAIKSEAENLGLLSDDDEI